MGDAARNAQLDRRAPAARRWRSPSPSARPVTLRDKQASVWERLLAVRHRSALPLIFGPWPDSHAGNTMVSRTFSAFRAGVPRRGASRGRLCRRWPCPFR
jgi:hypothetical protein